MRAWRYLMVMVIMGIALVSAACGTSAVGSEGPVELNPVYGEPLFETVFQFSRDPYEHIEDERMLAAWRQWERPDRYDPEIAATVDPAKDHPHKVAYMALLAWVAGDLEGLDTYWHPRLVDADLWLWRGEMGGDGGFKECFRVLSDDAKKIAWVTARIRRSQVPSYDLVDVDEHLPGLQMRSRAYPNTKVYESYVHESALGTNPVMKIWTVRARVVFEQECLDSTFTPTPISLPGVELEVGAYWLPREHRFAAGSFRYKQL